MSSKESKDKIYSSSHIEEIKFHVDIATTKGCPNFFEICSLLVNKMISDKNSVNIEPNI